MAHIVSVEWNVEDFRRLIGEQSQLSEAELPTAKTIDVVGLEITPLSGTLERSPQPQDAEVVRPKNGDLPDPKFVAADVVPGEAPTPDHEASFATALEIVDCEVVNSGKPGHKTSDEIADSCGAAVAVPPAFTGPAVPPAFTAKSEVTPKSSLLQNAIEGPDTRAGTATYGERSVLYRGVAFSKVKSARGELWRWSVLVGEPAMLRMGEAASEQQAELDARSVIDRTIAVEETLRRLKRSDRSD
ncbi:MAG: hypothetical protein ABSG88_24665 [Bradyrhizobium sp.]|jgi:hypothetical protein